MGFVTLLLKVRVFCEAFEAGPLEVRDFLVAGIVVCLVICSGVGCWFG